jgi:hypothetical protein
MLEVYLRYVTESSGVIIFLDIVYNIICCLTCGNFLNADDIIGMIAVDIATGYRLDD